jgi:hypothetical protein
METSSPHLERPSTTIASAARATSAIDSAQLGPVDIDPKMGSSHPPLLLDGRNTTPHHRHSEIGQATVVSDAPATMARAFPARWADQLGRG